VLTVAVTLGAALAGLYLHGPSGRKPILAVLHGLVAAAGVGLLLIALRGPRRGDAMGVGSFGIVAAVLFGIALVLGPFISVLYRRSPAAAGAVIATHASLAITGFVVFLAWVSMG
jgi:hypothetical protein